jgi:hypothetical protein
VYDDRDPDWALVGQNGQYGYAPANYIEKIEGTSEEVALPPTSTAAQRTSGNQVSFSTRGHEEEDQPPAPESPPSKRPTPVTQESSDTQAQPDNSNYQTSRPQQKISLPHSPPPNNSSPNSSHFQQGPNRDNSRSRGRPDINKAQPSKPAQYESDESDGPGLPLRRPGDPPYRPNHDRRASVQAIPPGFRTYAVMEVDHKKKRAATLGLGPNRIILLPDKSTRPREEWGIDDLTEYSIEGKHVFLDLGSPTRSLDLHAGSTDAAQEIVSAVGELRGLRKAVGLDEVLAAAKGGKKVDIATVLYDFPAQGDDELSVTAGDEVVILDSTNDEWWLVRRQVNGEEGVVPSKFMERGRKSVSLATTGIKESPGSPIATRKPSTTAMSIDIGASGVPERRSSLANPQGRKSTMAKSSMPEFSRLRYLKERSTSKNLLTDVIAEPDISQIRTWTDRSGSFKVEAQFLGCRDGNIHLHKANGVKIAVPVSKMSTEDLQYVELRTGICLDEDKPLSEILKHKRRQVSKAGITVDRTSGHSGLQKSPTKKDYDWFEFFLGCGVDVNNCQRYAYSFNKDEMDESTLEDITPEVMRTLGMKEGDILRVNKKLDEKYRRSKMTSGMTEGDQNNTRSLFTDEQGNLKTSRGRPPPAVQTGAVDPKALQAPSPKLAPKSPATPSSDSSTPQISSGFEDDAWAPKPIKAQAPAPPPTEPIKSQEPLLTGALSDIASLSLDTPALQPTIKSPPPPSIQPASTQTQQSSQPQPQTNVQANAFIGSNPIGPNADLLNSSAALGAGRTRPVAPAITGNLGIPPPPSRPLSAPQVFMYPPQPMMPTFTGNPTQMTYSSMPPTMMGVQGNITAPSNYLPSAQFPVSPLPLQQQITGFQPIQGYSTTIGMIGTGGINSRLPASLVPQPTRQLNAAPLIPQPTGPAPQVKFGVQPHKVAPQPTGRANLNKASAFTSTPVF